MIGSTEKEYLLANIRRLAQTLNALEGRPTGLLIFYLSRHLVVKSPEGTMAKSYRQFEPFRDELANLVVFGEINEARTRLLKEINNSDAAYLGLPAVVLDVSRMEPKSPNDAPTSVYSANAGNSLYDMMIKDTATFDDIAKAVVQIARIQQEGKIHRKRLGLDDVVLSRYPSEKDTIYFLDRFQNVFLNQLTGYGEVSIPPSQQQLMSVDWETLVAENLVRAHRAGNNGYYFDGNPRHHIINANTGAIVSVDFEYRLSVPALLGLASLVSFGLSKEDRPYLSEEDISKVLDRFLLEIEFVNALNGKAKDKAKRIVEYIKHRREAYGSDLSGQDSDEFFRFLDVYDSKERGEAARRDFLAPWPYALLDRNAAWVGHKARYRAVAEFLLGENLFREENIRFDVEDPVRRNAIEQRRHLDQILSTLNELQRVSTKNGRAQEAAKRLYDNFGELSAHHYFSVR